MSAVGQPNLRRWAEGWDGVLRRPKSCFVKEGFKLAAKTGYGRTVSTKACVLMLRDVFVCIFLEMGRFGRSVADE